jgi:hypothetical protein
MNPTPQWNCVTQWSMEREGRLISIRFLLLIFFNLILHGIFDVFGQCYFFRVGNFFHGCFQPGRDDQI